VSELVREGGSGDAAAIAAIDAQDNPSPWSASSCAESLLHCDALVAQDATAVVTAFVLFQVVLDQCEILNVAVDRGARRRGLGARLLQQALLAARARGARNCFLEVRESNHAARQLYRGAGFIEQGRRKGYYRLGATSEDALLMQRVLD
jgi:[ribosomal protein S18]-alanine N-acetyltransferase